MCVGLGAARRSCPSRSPVTLLYLQPRCLSPAAREDEQLPAGTAAPAVDWARPPVPTELISVLISHTGSVQQEQESSPRAKSFLSVSATPKTPASARTPAALAPSVRGPVVRTLVESQLRGRSAVLPAPDPGRGDGGVNGVPGSRQLLVEEHTPQRRLSRPRDPVLRAGAPPPRAQHPQRGGTQRFSFTRIPLLGPGNKFYCCFFAGKITEILSHNLLVALVGPGSQ